MSVAAQALAELDLAAGHAEFAVERQWCRPELEDGTAFEIDAGRHPVVEAALQAAGQRFTANGCSLEDDRRLWLMTGPNMAGKSTFLRQNALIVLLAQAGLCVPARRARIGLVDRLFSRVGASDDLARGRSTFMVEMIETAHILNRATQRSFVILDEIGRGTSTYDGMAIAFACLEHLARATHCRGLFATHYHELVGLADEIGGIACATMRVAEDGKGPSSFTRSFRVLPTVPTDCSWRAAPACRARSSRAPRRCWLRSKAAKSSH